MNVGSLFTGIRGLDLGLEAAGHRTAWTCENDPACQRVIARTLPGVPIIGDVREIDAGLPPVDILAGGFPCPDFSVAGKRLMFKGERAQLWFEFARAIRLLRPRHVIVENVPGLLAALGVVLADLAEAGYMGQWLCLRAADVGAPHRRERIFIVATDAERRGVDTHPGICGRDPGGRDQAGRTALPRGPEVALATDAVTDRASAPADTVGERLDRGRARDQAGPPGQGNRRPEPPRPPQTPADAERQRRAEGGPEPTGRERGAIPVGDPEAAADPGGARPEGSRNETRGRTRPAARGEAPADADGERGEPGSGRRAASGDHARRGPPERDRDRHDGPTEPGPPLEAPPDAAGSRRPGSTEREDSVHDWRRETPERPQSDTDAADSGAVEWGAYEPAIRRWEHIFGRPAPRPTDDRGRLNPAFVEWMLGFDDGWTAGEKRTARLRMLGNAVQVQVAEQIGALING